MEKPRLTLILRSLTFTFTLACVSGGDVEGDEAGECDDGIDNDQNGAIDCDDWTCASTSLCDDEETADDTGDDDDDTGGGGGGNALTDISVLSAWAACDDIGYFFEVKQSGLFGQSPELYIYETGSAAPRSEVHRFPAAPIETGPNGMWDLFYMELNVVEKTEEVEEGRTTLFYCELYDQLTWIVVVFDYYGVSTDCGAWGDDPKEANERFEMSCPTL